MKGISDNHGNMIEFTEEDFSRAESVARLINSILKNDLTAVQRSIIECATVIDGDYELDTTGMTDDESDVMFTKLDKAVVWY